VWGVCTHSNIAHSCIGLIHFCGVELNALLCGKFSEECEALFRRIAIGRPTTAFCLQLQEGIDIAAEEAISLLIAGPLSIVMNLWLKYPLNFSHSYIYAPQTSPKPGIQVKAPFSAPRACSRQSSCVPRAHGDIGAAVVARHNTDRGERPAAGLHICRVAMGDARLAFALEAAAHGT
jgi:hypothetical protein